MFLLSLLKVCQDHEASVSASGSSQRDIIHNPVEFSALLGSKGEGINLLEVEAYLRSSRIARKISSYCDAQEQKQAEKGL